MRGPTRPVEPNVRIRRALSKCEGLVRVAHSGNRLRSPHASDRSSAGRGCGTSGRGNPDPCREHRWRGPERRGRPRVAAAAVNRGMYLVYEAPVRSRSAGDESGDVVRAQRPRSRREGDHVLAAHSAQIPPELPRHRQTAEDDARH